MPNHITTEVEISGKKEAIAKLIKDTKFQLKKYTDVDNQFDFNGIVPMPKSLLITSGSSTDLGMMAYSDWRYNKSFLITAKWWNERYPGVTSSKELREFLEKSDDPEAQEALKNGKIALDNFKKYGHKDWYGWACDKWGTKWNAYNVEYIAHSDTKIVLSLQTAWNTPFPIWNKLEELGFEIKGVVHGEMDGYNWIGKGEEVFEAYQEVTVDYVGEE